MQEQTQPQLLSTETSPLRDLQPSDENQIREALGMTLCWLQHAYCLSRYVANYTEKSESETFANSPNEAMNLVSQAVDKIDESAVGNYTIKLLGS